MKARYLLYYVFFLTPFTLHAQFPSDYKDEQINKSKQQKTKVEVDTLSPDIYYFYIDNPSKTNLLKGKELHNFHIFDPIRQQEYDYINLGNFGSAHKSIVYQSQFHKGFDAGFHNYDLYSIFKNDIKYYQLEKAYSDVAFSQGASQQQTNFSGKFTKNISPLTNVALDFKRVNNKGQYSNQQSKDTRLSVNSWYHSPNNQYQAFLSYATNTIQQLDNGGVVLTDSFLTKSILSVGRPVHTEGGESRYFQRDLTFSHYYKLEKPIKDSLAITTPKERQFTLFHQLVLRRNTYRYADKATATSNNFYEGFFNDDRGVRNFMDIRQYENTFSIRTFRTQKAASWQVLDTDGSSDTKDLIEVGMTHTFTDIHQEPIDSSLHNIFLFGKIQYTPSERLKIHTYAHLGMLKQVGDYYIKGDFLFNLPKVGKLELGLIAQHYSPSLLQRQFYVTQQPIWQNNFKKTFENTFWASYYFPFLRLRVKGQYQLLSNYIYYDEQAIPQQAGEDFSVAQLIIENDINWKGVRLENEFYFQSTPQQYLRLPSYYSIHRLSYTNRLFKKVMEFQIGGQLRLHSPYFMDGFQPLTAQFHLQGQQRNTFHPNIDAFINVRIQDFRFFINSQNIFDYFTSNFYYPVYRYPQFDSSIRFGFRWVFLD